MYEFYISPDGNDRWSGRRPFSNNSHSDGPFLTLERAREAIRNIKRATGQLPEGGVIVWLRGGEYRRKGAFTLDARDSGTRESPIAYCNYNDEEARLIGGKELKGFRPATDHKLLQKLPESAHGKVMRIDLVAQGVTDFGRHQPRGYERTTKVSPLELFFNNTAMPLAGWTTKGWANIEHLPENSDGGAFGINDPRIERWKKADDMWVHGYWSCDWADSYDKVRSIDVEKKLIYTDAPHGVFGYAVGGRFRCVNVLEELDEPGEWFLDRKTGLLYFWPPEPVQNARATVSVLDEPFFVLDRTQYVIIKGITMECGRSNGIKISGGVRNIVRDCVIRNIGTTGVRVEGGKAHRIDGCKIYSCGEGGIWIAGGHRESLTPSMHYVVNNDISNYSRWTRSACPGIRVFGVGVQIGHNHIHDSQHSAILFNGNDHIIEYNEINNVCTDSNDVGALYTGHDYTQRGTIIRYNFIHDLGVADMIYGIYLDDCASGMTIYGNIFRKAGKTIFIGGGRDNLIDNNIFIDCECAIHIDARCLTWGAKWFNGEDNSLLDALDAMRHSLPPYSERYPELQTMLINEPEKPKNNRAYRNICVNSEWVTVEGIEPNIIEYLDNLINEDPGLVEIGLGMVTINDGSKAFELGIEPIPHERIGPERK